MLSFNGFALTVLSVFLIQTGSWLRGLFAFQAPLATPVAPISSDSCQRLESTVAQLSSLHFSSIEKLEAASRSIWWSCVCSFVGAALSGVAVWKSLARGGPAAATAIVWNSSGKGGPPTNSSVSSISTGAPSDRVVDIPDNELVSYVPRRRSRKTAP